jgi:hypothetical protein
MGNKINAPAFMIAENPMTAKQLFVIHTGSPYVMAEVHSFHSEDEKAIKHCEQQISVGSKTSFDNRTHLLAGTMIVPDEKFHQLSAQEQSDKLASLMRRMADWFHAYLKWNDEQDAD